MNQPGMHYEIEGRTIKLFINGKKIKEAYTNEMNERPYFEWFIKECLK